MTILSRTKLSLAGAIAATFLIGAAPNRLDESITPPATGIQAGASITPPVTGIHTGATCARCIDDAGEHTFHGGSCGGPEDPQEPGGGGEEASCMDCNAFNSCHTNWQTGSCTSWHWSCPGPTPDDIADVVAAVKNGDQRAIARARSAFPEKITLNAERGALQILNCTKAVVVHIQLDAALVSALADD